MKLIVINLVVFFSLHSLFVFGQTQHKEVKAKLETIFDDDQRIRVSFDSLINIHGYESGQVKFFIDHVMVKVDSANLSSVEKIIKQYGWLGTSSVGGKANQTLWLVVQHGSLPEQEKYLPLLRKSVSAGESLPMHLGMLEDRIALAKRNKQVYGTQLWTNIDGSLYIAPLLDPDKVNERRKEIGLGQIEIYAKEHGFVWDLKAYKLKMPEYEVLLQQN